MEVKITKMKGELKGAKVIAEDAKSTWEKLRKERDYHKTHQDRVNGEKLRITQEIKQIKAMHEEVEDKIEEIKKKLLDTTKEKALLKLEKDKLQKRAHTVQAQIKENEQRVQKEIEATHKRQRAGASAQADQSQLLAQSTLGTGAIKNTRMPEDARPNPFLSQTYDTMPNRLSASS